jgi:hypothetical protein
MLPMTDPRFWWTVDELHQPDTERLAGQLLRSSNLSEVARSRNIVLAVSFGF